MGRCSLAGFRGGGLRRLKPERAAESCDLMGTPSGQGGCRLASSEAPQASEEALSLGFGPRSFWQL